MKDLRPDEGAGKSHQASKVSEKALNAKDLTCQEAQIEELLSKGESTEDDADEAQDDSPVEQTPSR